MKREIFWEKFVNSGFVKKHVMNSLKGYLNYQNAEEASENQSKKKSIGISDVIHSMGAVFHIIQSFPKLSKRFNQKFSFDETNPFLSTKGQIISKANVLFLNSAKKTTEYLLP